jgi:acyl-ACP thioesterase
MWQETFRVRFFDAEPGGEASIPALCRFMEEAAHRQTESLGVSIGQVRESLRMWVLTRFALQVSGLPRIDDEVVVQTWASDRTSGIRAYRDFRMLDGAGKLLAQAASLWLLLDLKTRRPVRLPESVLIMREPERVGEAAVDTETLLPPKICSCEEHFKVRWGDLDENGHANNLRYIEWIVETVPVSRRRDHRLTRLDVQFLNEVLLAEIVHSVSGESAADQYAHSLTAADGRVLGLAHTGWELRQSSPFSSQPPAASA